MKLRLILLFLCCSFMANAQLEHVEPPFWWADMQRSELQILFHAENISDYEVSASDEVEILQLRKTENPNYLFITINSGALSAGTYTFQFKKEGKTAFSKDYELKERRNNSAARKGFDSSDMIYLLMPDRFANGKSQNDAIKEMKEAPDRKSPGGRHGGDIQGIIDHLDYLQDLGVTTLWSTPLNENNAEGYSYHGYGQSDVYRVDPRYGSNEEYKALAGALHERDMKLIMDYVTNHWGAEHWMIKDLPTYNWIHQFPGYANTNYRMTTQFDSHSSAIDKNYNENGWFVRSMPDLNQSNPLVLNYLIQNAIWWIEYADLDGFRVDTYSYNEKEGIAKWTKAVMDEYPNLNIMGEVWMHDPAHIAYWQKDSKLGAIQSFNSHLPTVMDFPLHDAMFQLFAEKDGWDTGMMRAYNVLASDFLYPDINNLLVFTENHDTQRINTQLEGSLENYKLATTLIATTRGIPQLYYGSEIGMKGDKGKGDGDIRRDFPGGWEGDATNAFTQEGRSEAQNSYHNFTKKIFNWRRTAAVIHRGELLHYVPEQNVYVFFRILDGQRVMVVLNNNEEDQELQLDRFAEGLKNHTSGKDILSGKELKLTQTLKVSAKTPMVVELN